jgi:acetolactate synthase small subunit
VVDQVSNAIDDVSGKSEGIMECSQDVADASQHLQAVVDADKAVVARIRRQLEFVHDIHSGGRYGEAIAEARFNAQAQVRAALFTAHAGLEAAAVDVSLAALVLGHVVLEDLPSQLIL